MSDELYIVGVPGLVGGAATKLRHLVQLLHNTFDITFIFPSHDVLKFRDIGEFLKTYKLSYVVPPSVPRVPGTPCLAICEPRFFRQNVASFLKNKGFRIIFSNEMMWAFQGEREAVQRGLVDKVLFVSEFQRSHFSELYSEIPYAITGNYVDPSDFPFSERPTRDYVTIGRLSRPDLLKFPESFPVFYERLGLRNPYYRVMAWGNELRDKFRWFEFDLRWDLLPPMAELAPSFLGSLDLFVYPLGHFFKESWGRSTVEAMLTGAVPLVPNGHHFPNLIEHGSTGFLCDSFEEFSSYARHLETDPVSRRAIARKAASTAREELCNANFHRDLWRKALME